MLWVNTAAQLQQLAIQRQLYAARKEEEVSRAELCARLDVSERTLRDWERCYVSPSLTNALNCARELGRQFVLQDRLTDTSPLPAAADAVDHDTPWELQQMRRLTPPLKSRRITRKISQTDLGLIVGVSRSSLQRWEDGRELPRLIALIVWADRLDYKIAIKRHAEAQTREA